jgi:hypothetical protein
MRVEYFFTVLIGAAMVITACPVEPAGGTNAGTVTALEAAIADAEAVLNSVTSSAAGFGLAVERAWATPDACDAFRAAIEAAQVVLNTASASQAEINAAGAALADARAAFEALVKTGPAAALARFNAPDAVYDGSAPVRDFGSGEKYLLYPITIDTLHDTVSIKARVKIITTSGHNGTGFISVNGSSRKGYMLLTAQNVKNTGTTGGLGGQGMETSVPWAAGQEYIFKSEITGGKINHYVYAADGVTLVSQKTGTNVSAGHAATDTVYAAIGGTNVPQMEWSEMVVTYNGAEYDIDSLVPQSVLPVLAVGAAAAHVPLNTNETIAYTATAPGGGAAAITAVSENPAIARIDSAGGGIIAFTGIADGSTVITVTNDAAPSLTATITVTVISFPASDNYGALTVYPAAGASGAYTDGELMITFDDVPVLENGGSICVYEKNSGTLADMILFADEKQTALGSGNNVINVGPQLVRLAGTSVYITPHFNTLEYGREYYIAIPAGAITATMNGQPFTGLCDNRNTASWSFTTRANPDASLSEAVPLTVNGSQNAAADFRTVYGALNAIASRGGNWTINVAPGTYTELVHYAGSSNVTINGMGSAEYGGDVIIQYANCNDMNGGTHTRPSFYFSGANLVLKNLTLKNTAVRGVRYLSAVNPSTNTQAETIFFANGTGKTFAAWNCSFLSHQDTIQTSGRNWLYHCYIEGDTDYIWGTADVCLLEECSLVSVNDPLKTSSKDAVLLVARTGSTSAETVGKGYVLFNSTVKTENGMTTYLSRNPGAGEYYDQAAVINTAFTNEGSGSIGGTIWSGSTYTFLAGAPEHVGWKLYNNTVDGSPQDISGMPVNTRVMSAAVYALEYNGRRAILNRVYRKNGAYENAAAVWDTGGLETDFGASADLSAFN